MKEIINKISKETLAIFTIILMIIAPIITLVVCFATNIFISTLVVMLCIYMLDNLIDITLEERKANEIK